MLDFDNPELLTFSNDVGDNFTYGFLIGTKPNDAGWTIDKKTGHDIIPKFVGKDFAIIPELIQAPIEEGGGGHYWGDDTPTDLLKGYAAHSHGKYVKIYGPYNYNDGTDDYYYNALIKLRDSRAASALVEHGKQTWIPYSVSPHIYPLAGPETGFINWEPIGGALVIRGAWGPQSVISKLCKGTMQQCEKSFGGSSTTMPPKYCEKKDAMLAQKISSYVSKSASSQTSMSDNKAAIVTNANDNSQPKITELKPEVSTKPINVGNPTVDSQSAITNANNANQNLTKVISGTEWEALQKELEESRKERTEQLKVITELKNDKKFNRLTQLFAKVKDEKKKKELIEKYMKEENLEEKLAFLADINPVLSEREPAPEEDDNPDNEDNEQAKAKKAEKKESKGGSTSSMKPEPRYISGSNEESKAGSTGEAPQIPNKAREIAQFIQGGLF